ncbi:MAG TPA: TIM-barrel domain-containing protein [Puia sp.]|jgi:alpha-glucosidase/alpha-D-xyloside xylohydrolase|nr:TIM-barrel domain-containing protein [Puia sp.]
MVFFLFCPAFPGQVIAQPILSAGAPAELSIREAGTHSLRITLKPLTDTVDLPFTPALADRHWPAPVIDLKEVSSPVRKQVGDLQVEVTASPLTVTVSTKDGAPVQRLVFDDSTLSFALDEAPVLGLGEGGHRPVRGGNWRKASIEFDRRGRLQDMQPRWQGDAYGSRNPVPLLIGTKGWALFVANPWGEIDLRNPDHGIYLPWKPTAADTVQQNERNQSLALAKGLPPASSVIPGLYDIFVFDAHHPADLMKDISDLTGPAVIPPKWALGYMQSHRTIKDDRYILGIVDSFRSKKIPVDAVIYLGTGFTPQGWNTRQPSFEFNPAVFHRDPAGVLADLHARHVKVVLHMVPYDRDKLPTLHGTIPASPGETTDAGHIQTYWQKHIPLMMAGADAFWPDEGDWFNLYERIERHKLYYQGPLSTFPDTRPWSLHRNGYLGVARWGGWVWSGDTESSWKTLEGQIAVGINHSLSLSPYWGSDIGGFYPNSEKTGELYARWFQFGAFCPSFRSHGRTTMTILPWGWGQGDRGDLETSTRPGPDSATRNVLLSSMNDPRIEPVVRKYDELRYQLLPYTYTLAWEARVTGMPLMRALWLHYPDDTIARALGSEYLWGRDLLIAPVFEKGATSRAVYLPAGTWYDWWSGDTLSGGRTVNRDVDLSIMPIYVRAGAIIPSDTIRQYTSQPVTAPTTLRIYPGADGDFTLYDDDGISQQYLRGRASYIRITWDDHNRTLTLRPASPAGLPVRRHFIVQDMSRPASAAHIIFYKGRSMTIHM